MTQKLDFTVPWDDTKRMVSTLLLKRGPTLRLLLQWTKRGSVELPKNAPADEVATFELVQMTARMYAALVELANATVELHNAILRFEREHGNAQKSRQ